MNTIRPNLWPQAPATPPAGGARPADAARAAAQKAFFEAALGRTTAPAQAAPPAKIAEPAPPAIHATPVRAIPVSEDPPQRILRPGSFVNIVV